MMSVTPDQFYYTVPGPAYQYHQPGDQGMVSGHQYYDSMMEAPVMMDAPVTNLYSTINNYPQISAQWSMMVPPDPVTVTTQNFLCPIPSTGNLITDIVTSI